LGFTNVTPLELHEHITLIAGELDYFDETDCLNSLLTPYESTENPATYFARNDKIEKQLTEAGYGDQSKQRLAIALTSFKSSGEYDAALREWDQRTAANKTFKEFRKIIVDEFTKHERRNKSTAKSVKFGSPPPNRSNSAPNQSNLARQMSSLQIPPRKACRVLGARSQQVQTSCQLETSRRTPRCATYAAKSDT
jgi:hypothetical protein